MIHLTTPTQQALAQIATAPATSDQRRRSLATRDRLALAACPMPGRCPAPCEMCAGVAQRVVEVAAMIDSTRENL